MAVPGSQPPELAIRLGLAWVLCKPRFERPHQPPDPSAASARELIVCCENHPTVGQTIPTPCCVQRDEIALILGNDDTSLNLSQGEKFVI